MNTATTQAAVYPGTQVAPSASTTTRLASLAMAAVLTLALLAGVDGLAAFNAPAPVMAQSSSTQG